eukprot:534431-Pelagomonas_calceolata.AAC.5
MDPEMIMRMGRARPPCPAPPAAAQAGAPQHQQWGARRGMWVRSLCRTQCSASRRKRRWGRARDIQWVRRSAVPAGAGAGGGCLEGPAFAVNE